MPTYGKVLGAFKDYLSEDKSCEVLNTSRGYLVVDWESTMDRWVTSRLCQTPEHLRDALRSHYEEYQTCRVTGGYKREPTPQEAEKIQLMGEAFATQCETEG